MATKADIRATAASLKAFLGVEAAAATALSSSIQRAKHHRDHDHVLEEAAFEVGGLDVTRNDHYAWVVRNPGQLTLYVDLSTDEYYIGAF